MQVRPAFVGRPDILQQGRPDDAAAPPDAGDGLQIQAVTISSRGLLEQGQALGVSGDHTGVQGVFQLVEEAVPIPPEREWGPGQELDRGLPLLLVARQVPHHHRDVDGGRPHLQVHGVPGGPHAGALLLGLVQDQVDERLAGLVVLFRGRCGR